jgi:hypothetical protein
MRDIFQVVWFGLAIVMWFTDDDPPKNRWGEKAGKKIAELVAAVKAIHGSPRGLPVPA